MDQATVAQLVEHQFCKLDVLGSSPSGGFDIKGCFHRMHDMNSKHWSWLNDGCNLHPGQKLPCEICITTHHPDVEFDPDEPRLVTVDTTICLANPGFVSIPGIMDIREDVVQRYVDTWKSGLGISLKEPDVTAAEANEIQRRLGYLDRPDDLKLSSLEAVCGKAASSKEITRFGERVQKAVNALPSQNPCGEVALTECRECSLDPTPPPEQEICETRAAWIKRLEEFFKKKDSFYTQYLREYEPEPNRYFDFSKIQARGEPIAKNYGPKRSYPGLLKFLTESVPYPKMAPKSINKHIKDMTSADASPSQEKGDAYWDHLFDMQAKRSRIAKLTCIKPTEEQIREHQKKYRIIDVVYREPADEEIYKSLASKKDMVRDCQQLDVSQDAQSKPEEK